MKNVALRGFVPFWYQVVLFVLTVILSTFFMARVKNRFTAKETYDRLSMQQPVQYVPDASKNIVTVGMYLHHFSSFNVLKDDFVADLIIWFEYDPHKTLESSIKKFIFENGSILHKDLIKTERHGSLVRSYYAVKVSFKTMLNYKDFPLDDHRVSLILMNLHDRNLFFKTSETSFTYSKKLFFAGWGWKVLGSSAANSFVAEEVNGLQNDPSYRQQRIIFSIDCMRQDIRHVLSILFPIFLILFILLFCFSLNTDDWYDVQGRANSQHAQTLIALILFAVSTLISYRFVIESISPDVDYFMLSDYLFFLLLAIILVVFILIIQPYKITVPVKMMIMAGIYASIVLTIWGIPG